MIQRFIWPILVLLGILSVFISALIDPGNGLYSLGFWLIPVGAVGGLVFLYYKPRSRRLEKPTQLSSLDTSLLATWMAAFFCIAVLGFGLFSEDFGTLNYVVPAVILTILGWILLTIRIAKK